jgi:hypothetical protein
MLLEVDLPLEILLLAISLGMMLSEHTGLVYVCDGHHNRDEETNGEKNNTSSCQNKFSFPPTFSITYISRDAKSKMTAIRVSRLVFSPQTVGKMPNANMMSVIMLKMMTGYCTLPRVVHCKGMKTQGCGN